MWIWRGSLWVEKEFEGWEGRNRLTIWVAVQFNDIAREALSLVSQHSTASAQ